MKRALVALLAVGLTTTVDASDKPDVAFDIYYKERGVVVEHASAQLAYGALSRVTLRQGTNVNVGAGTPGPDGSSSLSVEFDGPDVMKYPSKRVGDIRSDLARHQSSFVLQLPEGRDVTVIVRGADTLKQARTEGQ